MKCPLCSWESDYDILCAHLSDDHSRHAVAHQLVQKIAEKKEEELEL